MKRISVLVMLAIVLAGTTALVCHAAGTGATAAPDHITLTLTADPATTMTITWRTDTSVKSGAARCWPNRNEARMVSDQKATYADLNTDLGTVRIFTATFTGLEPNTGYRYTVGDGKNESVIHNFTTADPKSKSFKFLVFGDSQSGAGGASPYGKWKTTVHNAFENNPDAKFMVNVGDLVDSGQGYAHWNGWFKATEGVIDTIPEMAVQGNHETYGSSSTSKPVDWIAQFMLPQNGPAGLKDQVYSYNYGPVHFDVLDSQQDEEGKYGNILIPQEKWLESDLAASKAKWKITFFHKTPYDLKQNRSNDAVRAAFCPILEKHHVDFVFNGHDHGISRTYPIRDGKFMEKPSQGTIYYVAGRSGEKSYSDLEKKSWNTYFYNPTDQPNYMVVEVADTKITIKAIKQDGTLLDTFFVDKKKDVSSDSLAAHPSN